MLWTVEKQEVSEMMVNAINKERGLNRSMIRSMLSYNVVTVKQLSAITGHSVPKLEAMTRPRKKQEAALQKVTPFPDPSGTGPMFIKLDRCCNEVIMEALGI